MPELPEAETIARDLQRRLPGRTIRAVQVIHGDVLAPGLSPEQLDERLRERVIERVRRRGKNVGFELSGHGVLLVNLGMTGRLVVGEAPGAAALRHVVVRFKLDRDVLLFDDVRRFGRIDLYEKAEWEIRDRELGLEPLSEELTPERMHDLLRGSRTPVRNLLLDQQRVAGVGNIYANEALFRAGIRPTRRASTLRRRESAALRDALREVLDEAIAARGTTLNDYRDGSGEAGGFGPLLRVYGRNGEPCLQCGTNVRRVVLTNRSAFYCPGCQR